MIEELKITIECEDGFKLSGKLFKPQKISSAVMIAPATGIKKEFYASFAYYLAENGFATLTFDNRGIGESKGDNINSSNASLTNWGKLDMTAALEYLKAEIPNTDYHLIGHSAGGQLVGLMKNAREIKSMFNFGSSSGSLQNATYPFKLKSSFWLNFYIPVSNLFFGHTKSQWVGMGEPLPKNVGKEWTKWCNGKGYVKVDLDTKITEHLYNELDLNTLWVHAKDDDIANYANVEDMISVHPHIKSTILTLSPADYGYKDIGHMKFFSKRKKELWSLATNWLNENE
ncbi:alpha/beta fold hydrolase [Dokdonia sp. Asnod2-E02]|uniref:alpha/beta hydrolase family protein n=1 Tax=Dokdonia sp. Asnod2-E02 TaxID=3160574 RepID=UPI00386DB8A9